MRTLWGKRGWRNSYPQRRFPCAVAHATGKEVAKLPLTPPRVLEVIDGKDMGLDFSHIKRDWALNTIGFSYR